MEGEYGILTMAVALCKLNVAWCQRGLPDVRGVRNSRLCCYGILGVKKVHTASKKVYSSCGMPIISLLHPLCCFNRRVFTSIVPLSTCRSNTKTAKSDWYMGVLRRLWAASKTCTITWTRNICLLALDGGIAGWLTEAEVQIWLFWFLYISYIRVRVSVYRYWYTEDRVRKIKDLWSRLLTFLIQSWRDGSG